MEVTLYRADEPADDIIHELIGDADNAMQVDCADPNVKFMVKGWFVFPKGSLVKSPTVAGPT